MKCENKINKLIDELKTEGVSVVVIATENFSDGYYRATTYESDAEAIYIEDLLSGIAKVSSALRDRLEVINSGDK